MSKKFIALLSALFIMISTPAFSLENNIIVESPSQEYLEWLESPDSFSGGITPSPVDNSNLWQDPPRPREKFSVENILPAKYDLREHNRVPAIRNQNPWNACWSFAAIASLETSYIKLYPDSRDIDLSEMLIAYFAYGDKREGKNFRLNYYNSNKNILDQGGNYYQATALLSRLGAVNENILPYPTGNKSYTSPDKLPEEYEKAGIRLKASYEIGLLSGDEIINTVKNLIINNGAIYAAYYSDPYNYGYFTPAKSGVSVLTTSYFNNITDNKGKPLTPNHAISIIGWDDNFSRDNFGSMKPEKDGAWLVRNSWGDWLNNGGYFWMSYEQYIKDVTIYIADKMPANLKHYGYDDLGKVSTLYIKWSANIFKNESQDEILQYTGFNARDNNNDYEIYIYDLGTDKPSSPVDGVLLISKDNYTPYAGYHTEDFSGENIRIAAGHYFSVVMNTRRSIGTECTVEKAVVNPEESYYSDDGQEWNDLYYMPSDFHYKHNACIKAFTVPAASQSGIEINEINFPDQYLRQTLKQRTYDKDSDGILSSEEISDIKILRFSIIDSNTRITSLKGIELLTSLNYLDCRNCQNLTELNIINHPSLNYLYCENNRNLTNLNINDNAALISVDCYNNGSLVNLDVSNNPNLNYLYCRHNNYLTNLNIIDNAALIIIDCYYNGRLTSLNISNSPALNYLRCERNDSLISLDVSGYPSLAYFKCKDNNNLQILDITNNPALISVDCYHNRSLTSLNITDNPALMHIVGKLNYSRNLTNLNIVNNDALISLDCHNFNYLTSLNVNDNASLKYLDCHHNLNLISLNVSNNPSLISLDCSYNNRNSYNKNLLSFDISNNPALSYLDCSRNQLTELDISKNSDLTYLNCYYNQLTELDISKNSDLISLDCRMNQLTELDISKNQALNYLNCTRNQLTELDISKNQALTSLYCSGNQLTEFDVSKNLDLINLSCSGKFTEFDISKNVKLISLYCSSSTLTELDVSKNTALESLTCNGSFTELDISKNLDLIELDCSNTQITKLDISKNTKLESLYCTDIQLTGLDLSKNVSLTSLDCSNNKITKLDLSKNVNLQYVNCSNNKLIFLDLSEKTAVICDSQDSQELKAIKDSSGYYINLSEYMPPESLRKVMNVIDKDTESALNYDISTGIIRFSNETKNIHYTYNTGGSYYYDEESYYDDEYIASRDEGPVYMSADISVLYIEIPEIEIITPANLKNGVIGQKYNLTFEADSKDIKWELISGDLPDGLKFDGKKGTLSGKIKQGGKFSFTIKASKSAEIYTTKEFNLSVYTAPKISVKSLPSAAVNKEYSLKIDFTGSALIDAKCDDLPDGLSIKVVDGECIISGTPKEAGKHSLNISITNSAGTVSKKLSFAVFGFDKASLPEGTTGKKYKGSITVSGIKAGSWAISSGDLPDGLTLSKGKISGKPEKCGSFDFTVKVSAGEFFVEESYTIKIYPEDPVIKTKSLAKSEIYEPYNEQVELKSDGGAEITWSADFPEKLKGLEIDAETGIISGTPTHVFKGNVPVTATNNFGKSTTKNVKITITADKPKIIAAPLPAAKVGENYNFTLQASGSPILIWSGKLPAGLEIDESGDITGTPEKSGKFKFSVKVENEGGSKTKKFTLVINEADSTSDKNFAESDSDSQESESPAQNNNESESESENESISQEFTENNLMLDSAALSLVSNDDYMIAAILPDVEVQESGIYEFTVSLDKSIPENAELIWHSFPDGQISDSEDDNTAIFFNEDGQEIYNVPEDFCVIVSAWFEPGKIYKPVIAVKK